MQGRSPHENADDAAHLEVCGIVKHYGLTAALDGVSLSVRKGSVHALVGENGAGKSTLGKVIAGIVRPDEGRMLLEGREVSFRGPRDALQAGVTGIAQELALLPARSVAENVFLGIEAHRLGVVDRRETAARYEQLAERVGFDLPTSVPVGELRLADRQKVEIMRALARGADLIVMDEPTAALTAAETARLELIVRDLADEGKTVLFISHFLEDVLRLADVVSVLRDGKLVKTSPADEETPDSLVTSMLGRAMDVAFPAKQPVREDAQPVLEVSGISDEELLDDVSFTVREGEILGLAGLVGSGRTEVARAIFGARPSAGTIRVRGEAVSIGSPRKAIKAGIAMLPESRKEQGLFMGRSITENITVAHLSDSSRGGVTFPRAEARSARRIAGELDVQAKSVDVPVATLSGGNQQKVMLGRWLIRRPSVLIADEPTRGIDVGAKRSIYELIIDLASKGVGVVLISSELEEVLGLAHRILVMRQGRIVNELAGEEMSSETIMRSAFAAGVAA